MVGFAAIVLFLRLCQFCFATTYNFLNLPKKIVLEGGLSRTCFGSREIEYIYDAAGFARVTNARKPVYNQNAAYYSTVKRITSASFSLNQKTFGL
jgi:hypothetical protein